MDEFKLAIFKNGEPFFGRQHSVYYTTDNPPDPTVGVIDAFISELEGWRRAIQKDRSK